VTSRGPADVVRALYDASAAGEDYSIYTTGELSRMLRIEHEAWTHAEVAARSFEPRRLEVVRDDGATATVAIDGQYRLAYRQQGQKEWQASGRRIRGRVRLLRVEGEWKVADLPDSSGGMAAAAIGTVEPLTADGELELDAVYATHPKRDSYSVALRNRGAEPLRIVRVRLDVPVFGALALRLALPLTEERTLQPGGTWAFVLPWKAPFRGRDGALLVEGVESSGRIHTAKVATHPPRRPRLATRVRRAVTPPVVLEAAAIALLIWGQLPGWIVTSFLPGILLAGAALYRAAYLLFFVRYRGGGAALPLLVSLTAGELALGSWLFLREDPTLSGLVILGSLLALLTPTAVALFRRD
jgi:hypothetical protein